MDLKGVNVLVDGYNLELEKGTGVKTYGLTLIEALKFLDANVNVLFSRKRKSSKDLILRQALFFDREQKDNFEKFSLIKDLSKLAIKGFRVKAKIISLDRLKVLTPKNNDFINLVGILNVENCYKLTYIIYKKFNLKTKIIPPKKIDVWHATYPLPIKIKNAKKITTIHDLIPLKLPYTTLDDKKYFYRNIQDSLRDSAIILVPSQNTKNDILDIFEVNPDKIIVLYEAIKIKPLYIEEGKITVVLKRFKLTYKNYILFVGNIEPRKNIGRLIDAYTLIKTEKPLVIVGRKAWLWENEISNKELENVIFLDYVSDEDLRYLYAGAYCFVFPSLYEGFGLPVLEAMAFGCPVITSNVASLPEVGGDAVIYVNPYDVMDIRDKIASLLDNSQQATNLSNAGRERAKLFGIDSYIKKLYEVYSHVLQS